MRYELVIFDNDGVLVDSEPISNTILAEYLTELGHLTSYQESLRDYMGAAVHRVHDLVEERTGEKLPEDFDTTLHSRIFAAFQQELEPVPGVEDVLAKLVAEGIPYCVASSSSHERIRVAHRKTGIDQWFEEEWIFSSEDVGRGKPAPDLFLHAAERMGARPERCVVIEDSPLGVEAARAAGMDVYGFTSMMPADRLTGVTGYFSDMSQLPELLA
ncbi:HAD family hydrolase [Streptomyces sp. NPDC002669]|uniref:HAD family hydrolase n=1 Tax=unclassified Streptomyces TaxID=2593676 RepID=UPI0036CA90B5